MQEAQTRVDQAVSRTAAVLLDSERGEALVNITSLAKLSAAWRALRSTAGEPSADCMVVSAAGLPLAGTTPVPARLPFVPAHNERGQWHGGS